MELSAHLREHARGIHGKQQLLISAFAKALEVVPRQVAGNAGMDPTDVLNKLRMKHAHGGKWYGVDVIENGICDTMESFVWEATIMKRNALAAATESLRWSAPNASPWVVGYRKCIVCQSRSVISVKF